MKQIEKMIEKGISCMIPVYQPQIGNATKIIADDGSVFMDQRTIKTVLKIICQYYTIHIEMSRAKYGQMIHQRLCVPILIHSRLLLIPMKMRKPLFGKDGAYGYVNLYAIKEMKEQDKNTRIFLQNGMEVVCLHRMRTVQQHMNKAKVIAGNSMSYHRKTPIPEGFHEFYAQYNSPATKGDIVFLQKEILELTSILRGLIERGKEKG